MVDSTNTTNEIDSAKFEEAFVKNVSSTFTTFKGIVDKMLAEGKKQQEKFQRALNSEEGAEIDE